MVLQQGVEFLGIVVSRKDYKERDMLVKILTDKYGFKTFFVRGVRKRGFKLGAAILPFTHGTFLEVSVMRAYHLLRRPVTSVNINRSRKISS